MKHVLPFVILAAGSVVYAQTPIELAEKRLDTLLQPNGKVEGGGLRATPLPWRGPAKIEQPELPLPKFQGTPPPLPVAKRKPAVPRPLPEGTPLADYRAIPPVPRPVTMPEEPLVRLVGPDANAPLELPILARPQADRAALGDVTLEASVAAALAPQSPARLGKTPFAPLNLPDPFEHARAVRLPNPPPEDSQPPVIPVQTPRK